MPIDALLLILYIAALIGLMVLSRRLFQFFGDLELPQYLSTALFCTALVYLSALVPGIFGFLTFTNSYILFILLVIGILYWIGVTPKPQIQSRANLSLHPTSFTLSPLDLGVMIFGAILCAPLFSYLKGLPLAFADPNPVLGWDVVSYHLPGVIEFYQNKTLWSLSGPYQSYSFGYELIGNYFSQGFYTSWGLIIANLLALSLVVSAIVSVTKTLSFSDHAGKASWLASSILAIGLWTILAFNSLSAVGKNDAFMGATVLAALAFFLILCADTFTSTLKRNFLILLIGVCLGLSIASKPSAIAYLPFFWVATIFGLMQKKRGLKEALYIASALIAVALLVGGFWLARNLIVFGRLSPVLDSGWQFSILANVMNKEMYRSAIHYPAFMLATTAWIPAFLLALWHSKDSYGRLAWILIGSFHLTACLVFAITPFAYQGGGFETRLGMPLLISAAIIYGVVIPLVAQRLFVLRYSRLALGSLFLILMLAIPYYWSTKKQTNLFGYEEVFTTPKIEPLPRTNVYAWAQNIKEPLRIYSAGLRPYGLYGRHWSNTLFYDLHSSTLVAGSDGKKRIAAVVDQFGPDLILISLAPHANSPLAIEPEVLRWMQARTDLFSEDYSDAIVRGYRVKPGAKEILAREYPEPYALKMGE